ncbi:MAG: 2-C-methyl-D-erythritol 2,4-cyclodiphosphate synthase [Clostridia bacterium]|nr:2-C-methyl-D-erythritol 2,4-cyclodiphosphate synthase [Clostridia bacterium]
MKFRIGHGYDVHRLVEGRDLILGGVKINYEKGLLGHSDADVLCHAIADALLGSCGARDIGFHFPDNDPSIKDISSLLILKKCSEILSSNGYEISNIDATIIAQKPKLSPFIDEMRNNIAKALETSAENVNIKATTEEKLGFTGSGEGISAHAVCLVND